MFIVTEYAALTIKNNLSPRINIAISKRNKKTLNRLLSDGFYCDGIMLKSSGIFVCLFQKL